MDQHVSTFEEGFSERASRASALRAGRRRRWLRSALLAAGAVVLVGGGADYGHYWWTNGRFLVATDDATLQADNVIVSPKVSGYISRVLVADNQPVRAGEVLARIDDRDYGAALEAARAETDAQAAAIENLTQQIAEQQLVLVEARATVDADQAALTYSKQDYARSISLAQSGAGTTQAAEKATADIRQKQAGLDRDIAALGAAGKQIDVLRTQVAETRAMRAAKQAALRQAELNVGYTMITSPVDGTVAARSLRVGQYVQAGTELMAVVPLQAVYVTANYKETQLTDVHAGQPVTLEVDTFPGATVHGVVDSIAPASGQEFALLPPDNATGNFTKIVQRVPVKIAIDPHDALIGRLRPGMSVEPTIDTKQRA